MAVQVVIMLCKLSSISSSLETTYFLQFDESALVTHVTLDYRVSTLIHTKTHVGLVEHFPIDLYIHMVFYV